jgi:hypothetical protein
MSYFDDIPAWARQELEKAPPPVKQLNPRDLITQEERDALDSFISHDQPKTWTYEVKKSGKGNNPTQEFNSEKRLTLNSIVVINDINYKVIKEQSNEHETTEH